MGNRKRGGPRRDGDESTTAKRFGRVVAIVNLTKATADIYAPSPMCLDELGPGEKNEITCWVIDVFESANMKVLDPLTVRDRLWGPLMATNLDEK